MERLLGIKALRAVRVAGLTLAALMIGLITGMASVVLPMGIPAGLIGVAFLLLLWVIPDLRTTPDRTARFLVFPFVITSLSVPAYYTIILPGLPWISARRLALISLAVPTIIVLAGSSTRRRQALDALRSQPGILPCLLVFLACFSFATITSTKMSESVAAMSVFVTTWALPFVAILMLFRAPRDINRLAAVLCICTYIDFILGAIEFKRQRPFLIYFLPGSIQAKILSSADTYVNLFTGQGMRNGLYRAASTFNVSLSWGEMAAMLAPIAAHFAVHGGKIGVRIFGATGVVVSLGSIVCSGSRGAYLGFFVSLAVYVIAWAYRLIQSNRKSIVPFVLALILAVNIGAGAFAVTVAGVGKRFVLGGGAEQTSTDARWDQWALARPKILERPWGYGPGTAPIVVNYAPFGLVTLDSYFITGLVDYGPIGFVAWLLTLVLAIFGCIRTYISTLHPDSRILNALGCSLIAFTIYRLTLSQQENMTTMCVVLAMALVTLTAVKRAHSPSGTRL